MKKLPMGRVQGMGLAAAGALLEEIRTARGLSRSKLAALIGTDESGIERIERGRIDTSSSRFVKLLETINAPYHLVRDFVLNADATIEEAKAAARQWIEQAPERRLTPDEIARLEALDSDTLEALLTIARRRAAE